MAKYIDLVVASNPRIGNNNPILLQAPWLSHFESGDQIEYELVDGSVHSATVEYTEDIAKDSDLLPFLKACNGMPAEMDIPKITKKLRIIEVKYEDEDDD